MKVHISTRCPPANLCEALANNLMCQTDTYVDVLIASKTGHFKLPSVKTWDLRSNENPPDFISSHEHGVLSELLWSLNVRRCPSVRPSIHNLLVNTLVSKNINQSSPNLVKMYMTTRARMSSIMEPIRPELSELSALEFENLPYLTTFTL